MVQTFNLVLSGWAGNHEWSFVHENKTESEFRRDVNNLLKAHAEGYMNQEEQWCDDSNFLEYIIPHLKKLGYSEPPKENYYVLPEVGHFKNRVKSPIEGIIGREMIKRFINHNKAFEKKMDDFRL